MTIQPEEIVKDEYGFYEHSQYPDFGDLTEDDIDEINNQWKQWLANNNLDWQCVRFESDASDELIKNWFENESMDCSAWNPTPPTENSFLLSIHDTEDGPIAIFAIPVEK
jgi:hypothetical protein